MKWSDRPIPKQCESDKNCTSQYLYQYSAINGKLINKSYICIFGARKNLLYIISNIACYTKIYKTHFLNNNLKSDSSVKLKQRSLKDEIRRYLGL